MRNFIKLVLRDFKLLVKGSNETLAALMFYVLAIIMFPLSSGTDSDLLSKIAGGAIWMAALFSSLLSLDRMFRADFEDGSLELLVLSKISLESIILAKCLSHWLTNGLPLVILSPILCIIIGDV